MKYLIILASFVLGFLAGRTIKNDKVIKERIKYDTGAKLTKADA